MSEIFAMILIAVTTAGGGQTSVSTLHVGNYKDAASCDKARDTFSITVPNGLNVQFATACVRSNDAGIMPPGMVAPAK